MKKIVIVGLFLIFVIALSGCTELAGKAFKIVSERGCKYVETAHCEGGTLVTQVQNAYCKNETKHEICSYGCNAEKNRCLIEREARGNSAGNQGVNQGGGNRNNQILDFWKGKGNSGVSESVCSDYAKSIDAVFRCVENTAESLNEKKESCEKIKGKFVSKCNKEDLGRGESLVSCTPDESSQSRSAIIPGARQAAVSGCCAACVIEDTDKVKESCSAKYGSKFVCVEKSDSVLKDLQAFCEASHGIFNAKCQSADLICEPDTFSKSFLVEFNEFKKTSVLSQSKISGKTTRSLTIPAEVKTVDEQIEIPKIDQPDLGERLEVNLNQQLTVNKALTTTPNIDLDFDRDSSQSRGCCVSCTDRLGNSIFDISVKNDEIDDVAGSVKTAVVSGSKTSPPEETCVDKYGAGFECIANSTFTTFSYACSGTVSEYCGERGALSCTISSSSIPKGITKGCCVKCVSVPQPKQEKPVTEPRTPLPPSPRAVLDTNNKDYVDCAAIGSDFFCVSTFIEFQSKCFGQGEFRDDVACITNNEAAGFCVKCAG